MTQRRNPVQEAAASGRSHSADVEGWEGGSASHSPAPRQQRRANSSQAACSTTEQLLSLLSSSSAGAPSSYYKRRLVAVWSEACGSKHLCTMFNSFAVLQQHLDGGSDADDDDDGSAANFSADARRRLMSALLHVLQLPAVQAAVPANVLQAVQEQAAAAKVMVSDNTLTAAVCSLRHVAAHCPATPGTPLSGAETAGCKAGLTASSNSIWFVAGVVLELLSVIS